MGKRRASSEPSTTGTPSAGRPGARAAVRVRVKEMRTVSVSSLRANPKNWRTHPKAQQEALRGLLSEIGFAVPVVARETADGTLELIDGHLRVSTLDPSASVPVAVLDVTEAEADKLLATIDPVTALAGQADDKLIALLQGVDSDSSAVQEMMGALVKLPEEGGAAESAFEEAAELAADDSARLTSRFEILIECRDEQEQSELLERLALEGLTCRSLIS